MSNRFAPAGFVPKMFGMATEAEYADGLSGHARGRGAQLNPGNRYESVRLHVLGEHLDAVHIETDGNGTQVPTRVYADRTRSLINPVDSPDLPFRWTINPYRGCEHGCVYCYARPDHERLGWSSGLDFETKLLAKLDAPALLRKELMRSAWQGEPIMMAGVTDAYQPIERKLRLTRGCLEVMADCGQPVSIVTKNHLVSRDIDLLGQLAGHGACRVAISLTTLEPRLAATLEPRASSPNDRLAAMQVLAAAGIPVTVMVAPIIPGLNDRELPTILQAAADAGATGAGYVMLRLPYQVKALFEQWLREHLPDRADHVLSLVRQVRDGELNSSRFGERMCGTGHIAEQVRNLYQVFTQRLNLTRGRHQVPLSSDAFRRPAAVTAQLSLFDA